MANYDNINANDYVDDTSNLMNEYAKTKKAGGDYVAAYGAKPYQVCTIAYSLFTSHANCYAQGIGTGTARVMGAAVVQNIRSTAIRKGDSYFEESGSCSSAVNLLDRMYQDGTSVIRHEGKVKDSEAEIPDHFDKVTTYTFDDYRQAMGRLPSDPLIYLVSSKTTYLDETAKSGAKTSFTKIADGYDLELELKPTRSVVNYVRQMVTISSLASPPAFDYVHLSLDLDKDLNLRSMETHEHYYAAVSSTIGSYVEGRLRTVYQTDGNYTIPELTDPIPYRETM
jgi:hypothetical protein